MAQKLDESELVSFKELLMANSIHTDAVAQLLIDKDIFTEQELYAKLISVQLDYQSKQRSC